jgi:hypothetical protein
VYSIKPKKVSKFFDLEKEKDGTSDTVPFAAQVELKKQLECLLTTCINCLNFSGLIWQEMDFHCSLPYLAGTVPFYKW